VTHAGTPALRERILTVATDLFVARGYHGLAMREIAEAAGVSKPGLYYHFRDKEALFLAILGANLDRLAAAIAAARREPTTRAAVAHLMRTILQHARDLSALMRLAGSELQHVSPEARADFGRRYEAQFVGGVAALLADGVARGELAPLDPHRAAWVLLGMLYPFLDPAGPAGGGAPDAVVALLVRVFFDGAAAAPA